VSGRVGSLAARASTRALSSQPIADDARAALEGSDDDGDVGLNLAGFSDPPFHEFHERARKLSSDDIAKPTAAWRADDAVTSVVAGKECYKEGRDANQTPPPTAFVMPPPATDPITRMPYRPLLTGLTHAEQRLLFTLLTFPQVSTELLPFSG